MAPSSVLDLKAFVPAKDYRQAKQFYVDLGFKLNWDNPETAELQIGRFGSFCRTTTCSRSSLEVKVVSQRWRR
jgi:hypothetical protein